MRTSVCSELVARRCRGISRNVLVGAPIFVFKLVKPTKLTTMTSYYVALHKVNIWKDEIVGKWRKVKWRLSSIVYMQAIEIRW